MNTRIFQITEPDKAEKELEFSASVIRSGGLVVFPTETVYGLGGDATNENAAKAIYAAKGRPSDNPLIIHIAKPEDAEAYAETSATYYKLAKQFMPGPLTVILPRKKAIPLSVTGGLETVAVRCPSHPVAHALIAAAGVPIAAPSANLSGRPSPTLASHVIEDLNGRVDVIIDGGACDFGLESTIVQLKGEDGVLLRPGAITCDALRCVCKNVEIAAAVSAKLAENEHPLSPGMKYKHYAPRAPLSLLKGEESNVLSFLLAAAKEKEVGILCYEEELPLLKDLPATLFPVGKKDDLATQAHLLFASLREADEHPELKRLYAHLPTTEGIGLALYNRCIRAAAHTILEV